MSDALFWPRQALAHVPAHGRKQLQPLPISVHILSVCQTQHSHDFYCRSIYNCQEVQIGNKNVVHINFFSSVISNDTDLILGNQCLLLLQYLRLYHLNYSLVQWLFNNELDFHPFEYSARINFIFFPFFFSKIKQGLLPSLEDLLFYTIAEGQEKIPVHKFITVSFYSFLPTFTEVILSQLHTIPETQSSSYLTCRFQQCFSCFQIITMFTLR